VEEKVVNESMRCVALKVEGGEGRREWNRDYFGEVDGGKL